MDPNHLQIYDQALDRLRKSYVMVYDQSLACETGDVFVWLFQASDGYVHLLRQHTPESLVILAFFCTLMKRLEHHVSFVQNFVPFSFGIRLIARC